MSQKVRLLNDNSLVTEDPYPRTGVGDGVYTIRISGKASGVAKVKVGDDPAMEATPNAETGIWSIDYPVTGTGRKQIIVEVDGKETIDKTITIT